MSARLHRAMHDHHRPARLHALRGYARKCDRLDGRAPINWMHVALVLVALVAAGVGLGVHTVIAGIVQ